MNLFEELKYRNFIKDISNEEIARKMLNEEKTTFYCGFDATAESLTIGHLVQIVRIKLLQKYGHTPIILVGGATGLIGDPKETSERKLLQLEDSLRYAEEIKSQLNRFFNSEGNNVVIVNNYDWISKINVLDYLRNYGKHFTVSYMLAKDTVAKRLEIGISYTEFSYMLIQAIDWLHLYKNYNCKLQFGGSDQWGNITAGLDLIRKMEGDNTQLVGISSHLLTKADGTKFGKSEEGALWLDEKLTSPYEIYQYFINTSDSDVINLLKSLTLLTPEEINNLAVKVKTEPHLREAQRTLAKEVVELIHSKEAYANVEKITNALFSGDVKDLTIEQIEQAFKGVSSSIVSEDKNILDILVKSKLASSKREASEFIENGAVTVNGTRVNSIAFIVSKDNALYGKYTVIRRGKKNYHLMKHK
ncbi:MAG: tyrosine--tRNA ligase [Bacilli bacterium]|nr:tyrosine--tRNA ligase [Bacilli bacterium]